MNYIWFLIIAVSIIFGALNGRLSDIVSAILSGAEKSVQISIYLIGIMAFWLGIMKIAEKSGCVDFIAKLVLPAAKKLFPEIKDDKAAIGSVAMNFAANMFGLSNAATPMGINAIEDMQKHNINKKSASNSMCTLLAMNTAGFQLVPATVIAILAANGDKNPTVVVLPTLIVTTIAFVSALVIVKVLEKLWTPQIAEIPENEVEKDV